jgi:hypothetical protein
MAEKVTYYAIVDSYSSRDEPAGVLRRIERDKGQRDQAFGRDLRWEHTPLLYSYERGNMDNQLYEIAEDQAAEIMRRIRRQVTGGST